VLWKLTRSAAGEPEIDVLDDEDRTFGFSILRELARTNPQMHRVGDGRYRVEKPHPCREV
jgi:hypothetical protein